MNIADIAEFLGDGGTFSLTPNKPVHAELPDGTTLDFVTLHGRFKGGSSPEIYFEPPMPIATGTVLGILRVGATVRDLKYGPPATVGTSKGRFRLKIETIP